MIEYEPEYEHGMATYLPMAVTVEVWPVAADAAGIWLLSGEEGPWPSLPVSSETGPHAAAQLELIQRGALGDTLALHSTAWRPNGPVITLTYVAVLSCHGPIPSRWPDARPVSVETAAEVGSEPSHAPTDPPMVRLWGVLLHGIRHIAFLRDTDAAFAATLDEHWGTHLATLQPAIAVMYSETA